MRGRRGQSAAGFIWTMGNSRAARLRAKRVSPEKAPQMLRHLRDLALPRGLVWIGKEIDEMTVEQRETVKMLVPGNILRGEGDFAKDVVVGTGHRHVALCTLWTSRDIYAGQLPHIGILGNLYFRLGIGVMIRNVLATPEITHIIVTGKDNPQPKQHNGDALLKGEFDPSAEPRLTADLVAEFYRRVTLIDARHISLRDQESLTRLIEETAAQTASGEVKWTPVIEPLAVPLPERFPTSRSGHLIRAESIAEGHIRLLREIRTFGEITQPDDRGRRRQELWQLTVCLTGPLDVEKVPNYSAEEVIRYCDAMWNGDEPEGLTYRYGHTIRRRYGDQLQAVIDAFAKKPETFRTVISLWEPLKSMERDDEPCLITVHPRVRNGVLDMFAYIRTNEMHRGWPQNAAGLRSWQERLAKTLNVEVGELTITSGSAHIYDYEFQAVDTYLSQNRLILRDEDPKGDWILERDGELFVAKHLYQGTIIQVLDAKSAEGLERKLVPYVSDISHAMYL